MTRNRKLYLNILTALISQLVVLVCGFILPRYILGAFGSEVNGLVASITRFLSVISFLELGVGPVVQSNLYKPLAENNQEQISQILVSTRKFYRRIAYLFLAYIGILFFVYPLFNSEFDYWFTASLLLIISISSFIQYYFGLTYQVLLTADQKVYLGQVSQIVTVVLNTVICIVLIKLGYSIHIVKLFSAIIYVIRPFFFALYVKKKYSIDWKIRYDKEPIKQKWNGFAQHLAAVICGEIDVILLTFFADYQSVSIYSTYFLVVNGITTVVLTFVSGLEAYWGNMLAKGEQETLKKSFINVEMLMHVCVIFVFSCTAFLVEPFVKVYVNGISDAAVYSIPIFGIILSVAYACRCLRLPYFQIISAAGHYKETQVGAFISMSLNIIISVVLVIVLKNKLLGVAIGTVVAMLYHTIYFACYLRKNIINRSFGHFVKHMLIDIGIFIVVYFATKFITFDKVSYIGWILMALKVAGIAFLITLIINLIFYFYQIKGMFLKFLLKVKEKIRNIKHFNK